MDDKGEQKVNAKYLQLSTCLSFLVLALFTNTVIASTNAPTTTTKKNINYLFVQSASKLRLEQDREKPNTYKLLLRDVSPDVTYFTERPYRKTSMMPIEAFVKLWHKGNKDSFMYNPPNAAVVATQRGFFSKDKELNVVMELSEPSYDQDAKTLRYTAKLLEGNMAPDTHLVTFKHAFLFIDDACLDCFFP